MKRKLTSAFTRAVMAGQTHFKEYAAAVGDVGRENFLGSVVEGREETAKCDE